MTRKIVCPNFGMIEEHKGLFRLQNKDDWKRQILILVFSLLPSVQTNTEVLWLTEYRHWRRIVVEKESLWFFLL